jgi:hypothetical protein
MSQHITLSPTEVANPRGVRELVEAYAHHRSEGVKRNGKKT